MIKVDRVDVAGEGKFENVIILSEKEWDNIQLELFWLDCLNSAGVDNWEGYSYANDLFNGVE